MDEQDAGKRTIRRNQYIHIPPFGQSKQLNLKSNNYVFS